MQFDRGDGNLALLLVGQAEGDGAGHGGMGQHGLFQFADVNRVAARLDHILHAPHQPDQSEAVARGQIAGAQPAIAGKQGPGYRPCPSNSAERGRGGESGTRRSRRRARAGHFRRPRGCETAARESTGRRCRATAATPRPSWRGRPIPPCHSRSAEPAERAGRPAAGTARRTAAGVAGPRRADGRWPRATRARS